MSGDFLVCRKISVVLGIFFCFFFLIANFYQHIFKLTAIIGFCLLMIILNIFYKVKKYDVLRHEILKLLVHYYSTQQ